jgi:hypothetical protein
MLGWPGFGGSGVSAPGGRASRLLLNLLQVLREGLCLCMNRSRVASVRTGMAASWCEHPCSDERVALPSSPLQKRRGGEFWD